MRPITLRSAAGLSALALAAGSAGLLTAVPTLAAPAAAAASTTSAPAAISEIAYAGKDDTDFIEITAAPGTDLSGWTVGSVSRGGTPQSAAHVTTLPAGTAVSDSGALAIDVPITNSVNPGSAADGSYGSSAFVVDDDGGLIDFAQIGGTPGGRGVQAKASSMLPDAVVGKTAEPTGATARSGESIAKAGNTWSAGVPTPNVPTDASPEPTDDPSDEPTAPAETTPIAEIQGTGASSPLEGRTVTTRGVVTAVYPEGGLNGYYIQTAGTGGDAHRIPGASEGLFVYSPDTAGDVRIDEHVEVTGKISEYYGQTQITVARSGLSTVSEPAAAPKPVTGALPEGDEARESLEGMLVHPAGPITITDTYSTNRYGEVGLTNGEAPLRQHTDAHRPGSAEAKALEAANAKRFFALDDGATRDYTNKAADVPVPYVSTEHPVRVGATATFTSATVLGYGHDVWRLQPTAPVTGDNEEQAAPATFENDRPAAPDAVGGKLSISSFNVLNYFPTTGDQLSGCSYYTDRAGNPITVRSGCAARGAANAENLARQQAKIVAAINTLDAAVLGLEEIEQSKAFGKDRDTALTTLVQALNTAAGTEKWAAIASPEAIPAIGEDVIRTAFIYQPARVRPVGDSAILDDPAFKNARAPLAQGFASVEGESAGAGAGQGARGGTGTDGATGTDASGTADGAGTADGTADFVAIVNHFKSKGSGSGAGNEDSGDGQGASVADRVKQATALVGFAEAQKKAAGTEEAFLLGDFNSYAQEDPMQVLYDAGYANLGEAHTDEQTYLFGGRVGSLDHVLATSGLAAEVTGADVWNINSVESVGLEYSRYNSNARALYDESVYRSSDHDPLIVGFGRTDEPTEEPSEEPTTEPTDEPSEEPSTDPTGDPTTDPTTEPSTEPTDDPTDEPSGQPSVDPSGEPTDDGTGDDGRDGGPRDRQHDGQNDGRDGDRRALPRTGTSLTALGVGAVLLTAGTAAVLIARRRTR